MPRASSIHPRQSLRTTLSCRSIMFPCNPFRSNTSKILRKCSFQKTYSKVKSFRSNTYKKTRGGPSPSLQFQFSFSHSLFQSKINGPLPSVEAPSSFLLSSCWGAVGAPLFFNGKCNLSLFSLYRYPALSIQTRGVHPHPPPCCMLSSDFHRWASFTPGDRP
jgi:hypothetical protein